MRPPRKWAVVQVQQSKTLLSPTWQNLRFYSEIINMMMFHFNKLSVNTTDSPSDYTLWLSYWLRVMWRWLGSDERFGRSLSSRHALRTNCLATALQFGLLFTSSPRNPFSWPPPHDITAPTWTSLPLLSKRIMSTGEGLPAGQNHTTQVRVKNTTSVL